VSYYFQADPNGGDETLRCSLSLNGVQVPGTLIASVTETTFAVDPTEPALSNTVFLPGDRRRLTAPARERSHGHRSQPGCGRSDHGESDRLPVLVAGVAGNRVACAAAACSACVP